MIQGRLVHVPCESPQAETCCRWHANCPGIESNRYEEEAFAAFGPPRARDYGIATRYGEAGPGRKRRPVAIPSKAIRSGPVTFSAARSS